ncbi:MAG TPA: peptide-methionine (S)-S-oxide reductase MsrA [Candidatus Saccharimonadales bacterium]|nr:peptide-methionine (S)-S-oxide reductase MsrA [Candidatus Saccharimonadales bacterium]
MEQATFGAGCFWCTEAIFKRLKGVENAVSGYAGGTMENPTYEDVVYKDTGHAESIQITFDPSIISYEKLLDVFWATHNPTTLNRQNYDTGPMYRSVIFYHNDNQKEIAQRSKREHQKDFTDPIVTEIVPFENFYHAEEYHKDYYDKNKQALYCSFVIDPKIQKLLKEFRNDVKEEYKG